MLIDQIKGDVAAALKAGNSLRVSVLRMVLSELNYKRIEVQRELVDADVVGVMQKEVKKRREAAQSFRAGGREGQAQAEEQELAVILEYLPREMTEEEIKQELVAMNLPGDFGAAMKMANLVFRGRASGSVVAKLVKELCQQ